MRSFMTSCIAATAVCVLGIADAQANDANKIDMGSITCRDLLKMSGEEEQNTMIFFHGYFNGIKKDLSIDEDALTKATDDIKDFCIDNTNETVAKAFEKFR